MVYLPDDKEARAMMQQEKRSSFFTPTTFYEAQSCLQESKCDKTSTAGFLPLIPQRIIISPATLTMMEQPPGSFGAACLKSGDQRLRSCGYMANVCFRHSLQLTTSYTYILIAGSGKSVLWLVTSLWLS
jgi:hypothetical protein